MKVNSHSTWERVKRPGAWRWRLDTLVVKRLLVICAFLLVIPALAWSATPVVEWRMDNAGWLEPSNGQSAVELQNSGEAQLQGTWVSPRLSDTLLHPAIPTQTGTCGYVQVDGKDSYIEAGNPDLGLGDQVTVMAWIRWDIDPATGHRGANIISLASESLRYDGQFWLQHSRWRNRFAFVVRTDRGKRALTAPSRFKPIQDRWYHLAGVYDGEWMKLYIDGQLVRQRRHQGNFNYKDTYQLLAGRQEYSWWNHSWASRYFEGDMDEIRIYNVALSDTEVRRARGTSRACATEFADFQAPIFDPMMALYMDEAAWSGSLTRSLTVQITRSMASPSMA